MVKMWSTFGFPVYIKPKTFDEKERSIKRIHRLYKIISEKIEKNRIIIRDAVSRGEEIIVRSVDMGNINYYSLEKPPEGKWWRNGVDLIPTNRRDISEYYQRIEDRISFLQWLYFSLMEIGERLNK